jgi:hypothetical protein
MQWFLNGRVPDTSHRAINITQFGNYLRKFYEILRRRYKLSIF